MRASTTALQNPLPSPGAEFHAPVVVARPLEQRVPTELLQVKILSPPASRRSAFVPPTAALMAERRVLSRFACGGFGSAPAAPASRRVQGQERAAGEAATFIATSAIESELVPCKEDRESRRSSGRGDSTNHLSATCSLHELAQQKAIFRLKCFKLQRA